MVRPRRNLNELSRLVMDASVELRTLEARCSDPAVRRLRRRLFAAGRDLAYFAGFLGVCHDDDPRAFWDQLVSRPGQATDTSAESPPKPSRRGALYQAR